MPQDFLEGLPSSPDHCRDRQGPSIGVSGMCTEKGVPVRREETSYAGYEGACLTAPPPPPRYVSSWVRLPAGVGEKLLGGSSYKGGPRKSYAWERE